MFVVSLPAVDAVLPVVICKLLTVLLSSQVLEAADEITESLTESKTVASE